MTMVSWPETARGQLRLPAVCAASGQPATTSVRFVFRSRWARFAPGVASLVLHYVSPRVDIPLAAVPAQRIRIGRVTRWAGAGFFVVAEVVGLAVQRLDDRIGAAIRLVGFAGLVMLIVGSVVARRVLVVSADSGWLSLENAHPAFVDALIRLNVPGMVQVPGGWPQQWGYQLRQPGNPQPPGYAQPPGYRERQQPYPQQGYGPRPGPQPPRYGEPPAY